MIKQNYSVGDILIDSDQIYIITKIEDNKIFYQPVNKVKNCQNTNYTCSIPTKNLSLACIRSPLTKSEVESFIKNLPNEEPIVLPFVAKNQFNNSNFFKDFLLQNDPNQTGKLLVYFSKAAKESKLTKADQLIFDQALFHLADEIAFVSKISFNSAKMKILRTLNNCFS